MNRVDCGHGVYIERQDGVLPMLVVRFNCQLDAPWPFWIFRAAYAAYVQLRVAECAIDRGREILNDTDPTTHR